jgi:GNAT superfamily N-acetyltransferase
MIDPGSFGSADGWDDRSMDLADRVAASALEAERIRALTVEGGVVLEVEGLVVTLTNLPAPELNGVRVATTPLDPAGALATAEQLFRDRGHRFFGIEVEVGRYPTVEEAIREAGLERVEAWPAMAVAVGGLPDIPTPERVTIRAATEPEDLAAVRAIEMEAFGTTPDVVERFIGVGLLDNHHVRAFSAWLDGEPVGEAFAYRTGPTVGIFGVGVLARARRRGIGAALTGAAARAFGDAVDVAWLQPSTMAEALYERLGFRTVSRWEVWVRT